MEEPTGQSMGRDCSKDASKGGRKRRNPFSESKEDKQRRQKKRARIIVRNISYKSDEDKLKKHFGQWGTVEEVNLLKRPDGKLVGCAFVQFEKVNEATKAILKGNSKEFLGRPIYIDWAIGKDEYKSGKKSKEPSDKKPKLEIKEEDHETSNDDADIKEESCSDEDNNEKNGNASDDDDDDDADDDEETDGSNSEDENIHEDERSSGDEEETDSDADDSKSELKDSKLKSTIKKEQKHISNDVIEGRTVFIKNVPFEATDDELRKLCRKFGPINYAIINREAISGHSKGTGFVKFKTKESADLCLQAGPEFTLQEQQLETFPALSREEIQKQNSRKDEEDGGKDSRNLYLAREGLIMSGSKSAEGVSASDMAKRHQLEQLKTQVLKNLNRFVSRNRLSIHNLPSTYDNEKLKQLIITHTGFRPHECRVMRENKITPEHPQGKSKGFGFMSFKTHREALTALRKLNNNPNVFNPTHRPIIAFSIEDRAVHKIKEKRKEKSKLSNPTYQKKLEERKNARNQKRGKGLDKQRIKPQQADNKEKLKKHIKKLENVRAAKSKNSAGNKDEVNGNLENFVGTAAKPGSSMKMRSNKKIAEQSQEHKKRVKANKRKEKQRKIQQMHLAERKADIRPKQGRKVERDDLAPLVNKYKQMISGVGGAEANFRGNGKSKADSKTPQPKRKKWYTE